MQKIYFKQLIVAMFALLCSVTASAKFEVGGIYYNVTSEADLTVEVTYKNSRRGRNYSDSIIVIPSKVTYEEKVYNVTKIGDEAFYYCSSLGNVTIPSSVTSIGYDAFYGCHSLNNVHINNLSAWCNIEHNSWSNPLNYAQNLYLNGELLTSVTIPDDVKEIKNEVFVGYTKLTSVTIPNSVTSIGSQAFYYCDSLKSVTIGNSVTEIGEKAFYGCKAIKTVVNFSNLTINRGNYSNGYVGYYADKVINAPNGFAEGDFIFKDVEGVKTLCGYIGSDTAIVLPENCKGENYVIGENAFYGCSSLTSIEIPNSVTSIGDYAFNGCSSLTSIEIPNSVTSIGVYPFVGCRSLINIKFPENIAIFADTGFLDDTMWYNNQPDGVVYIGNVLYGYKGEMPQGTSIVVNEGTLGILGRAFYYCRSLTSIEIPNSVTSIGNSAFYDCSSLTSIEIPNSVTSIGNSAFYYCDSLKSVTIGNSVTSIGEFAFWNCNSLTSITIPNSVTSIGDHAFERCTGLANITVEESNNVYDSRNNCNAIIETATNTLVLGCKTTVIPNDVTSIGDYAFNYCYYLTSITIPNSVTSIGDNAFDGCTNLANITVEESNNVYDSRNNCNAIIETATNTLVQGCYTTVIPNDVTSIGDYAFNGCPRLTSIEIPNSVTSIGNSAFDHCYSLTSFTIPENVTNIGGYAFSNCSSLTSVTIPNSVTSIGDGVFISCSSLTSITIPNSVTSIGYHAFYGCRSLTSIEIPNSVTSIGERAFYDCRSLTSITIPNSVTSIGYRVFSGCTGLKNVYLLSETPPATYYSFMDDNPMYNHYNAITLYVPHGALAAYKATEEWGKFVNIVEFDPTGIEATEEDAPAFEITAGGIQLTAAEGKAVVVYTAGGSQIVNITNYAGEEIVLEEGVYIVRVGNRRIKIKL